MAGKKPFSAHRLEFEGRHAVQRLQLDMQKAEVGFPMRRLGGVGGRCPIQQGGPWMTVGKHWAKDGELSTSDTNVSAGRHVMRKQGHGTSNWIGMVQL